MPQVKEFDKDIFVENLLSAQHDAYFARVASELAQSYNTGKPLPADFDGVKTDKEVGQYKESDKYVASVLYNVYKNLNAPESSDFFSFWKFFGPIMIWYQHEPKLQQILLVVNKLNIFNEQTQLKILNYVRQLPVVYNDSELLNAILVKMASNPYISAIDKAYVARETLNRDIIRDAIEGLRGELNNEMHKDFPDSNTIDNICRHAQSVMIGLKNKLLPNGYSDIWGVRTDKDRANKELNDYINTVMDEFDMNKILAVGAEYVPQTIQSLEERAARADNAIADAQHMQLLMKDNNERMQRMHNDDVAVLQAEKTKNEQLVRQLNDVQNELNAKNNFIKTLQIKSGTLKMGVFGNGKDFQAWLMKELAAQKTSFII